MAHNFTLSWIFAFSATVIIVGQMSQSVDSRIVHRIHDFNVIVAEPITKCRMSCLVQFIDNGQTKVMEEHDPCTDRPDCFMCWDFCRILYTQKPSFGKLMCNNAVLCFDGCKFACAFHKITHWEQTNMVE